jgi:hypothetical protein
MLPDQPAHDDLLSPAEVRRILERAVRIDATIAETTTIEQLTAVAAEAGISQHALIAAVREELQSRQSVAKTEPPSTLDRVSRWIKKLPSSRWPDAALRALAAAFLGTVVALWTYAFGSINPRDEIATVGMAVVSLLLAYDNKKHGTRLQFQAEFLGLWAGYITASGASLANPGGHTLELLLICLVASVLGRKIVSFRQPHESPTDTATGLVPPAMG